MSQPAIPLFKVFMNPDVDITKTLTSGLITQGPQVEKFEKTLTDMFSWPYILTVNSATSGLTLAIRMIDLPPGSEILSTPLTCVATNFPVLANGHKIKWVDVDTDTCNMCLIDLERKISESTRAIMVVHWGGYPIDLDRLKTIQQTAESKYGHPIPIIEDCAHAFGATFNGTFIGTHGNICVFSLQAIKHLTTGDGGLIFLPTKELYDRAKLLRWYGISREQRTSNKDIRMESDIKEWGYKYHMNDVNASIGLSNLPFVKDNLARMRKNAEYYKANLQGLEGINLMIEHDNRESAYWVYSIKITDKPEFIDYMKDNGVMVSQVHNRNDIHTCLAESKCELPRLDILEKHLVCIPSGWWLTQTDLERIVDLIKTWNNNHTYNIRLLLPTDYYNGYLELLAQMNGYTEPYTHERFEETLLMMSVQGSSVYVLEYNGKLLATAKLIIEQKFYAPQAHIEDVVVDKDHRRKGLASKLLNHLNLVAKDKKCYKITLCAKPELEKLYNSVGFKTVGQHFVIYPSTASH